MGTRKVHGSWWTDFRFNRKRHRYRSPENSKAGAEAYEAMLRQKLARGESMEPTIAPVAVPLFSTFSEQWYETYVKTNNKYSEQRYKRSVLRKHLVPFFGKLPLDQIAPMKIEEFKVLGLKKGLAPKSVNNCLSILRKALNDAREWEIIENVPRMQFLKVPPSKFDFLTEEESEKLLAAISNPFWHSMVLTALKTGLRLSELVGLRWEDMSLNRRMLAVKRGIVRGVVGSPKSNKERHIPLTQELSDVLSRRAKKEGWVFTVRNDNPLDHKTPSDALHRFCRLAGLRLIGWHMLRHSFASRLVLKGVSIKAVQELLGHSDIQTTMRYAHLAPSALRDAISVLEKPDPINFGQQVVNTENFLPNRSFESLFSSDEFSLYEKQKRGI